MGNYYENASPPSLEKRVDNNSPSIDLDMNLLSSPVPPARSGHGHTRGPEFGGCAQNEQSEERESRRNEREPDGRKCGHRDTGDRVACQVQVPPSPKAGPAGSLMPDIESGPDHSNEFLSLNNNGNEGRGDEGKVAISETVQEETFSEKNSTSHESTENYDDLTRMVESWREELYVMNVKNSILLDDMVKLGADV